MEIGATVSELAERFGRKPRTIRDWIAAGRLPGAYKLMGTEWRVPESAVQTFLEAQRAGYEVDDGEVTDLPAPDLGAWKDRVTQDVTPRAIGGRQ